MYLLSSSVLLEYSSSLIFLPLTSNFKSWNKTSSIPKSMPIWVLRDADNLCCARMSSETSAYFLFFQNAKPLPGRLPPTPASVLKVSLKSFLNQPPLNLATSPSSSSTLDGVSLFLGSPSSGSSISSGAFLLASSGVITGGASGSASGSASASSLGLVLASSLGGTIPPSSSNFTVYSRPLTGSLNVTS